MGRSQLRFGCPTLLSSLEPLRLGSLPLGANRSAYLLGSSSEVLSILESWHYFPPLGFALNGMMIGGGDTPIPGIAYSRHCVFQVAVVKCDVEERVYKPIKLV